MPPGNITTKEAIVTHRQQNALDTELYPHSKDTSRMRVVIHLDYLGRR